MHIFFKNALLTPNFKDFLVSPTFFANFVCTIYALFSPIFFGLKSGNRKFFRI